MQADPQNISDEEKLASYKDTFALFDQDNSDTITTAELGSIISLIRAGGWNPTERDLEEILRGVDKDCSGSIDFEEFLELMERTNTQPAEEFNDGSGKINPSELGQVMENLGEKLSPEELRVMGEEADGDQ